MTDISIRISAVNTKCHCHIVIKMEDFFFYIILGQCTETMFCSAYRCCAIEPAMYVTDNAIASQFVCTKQRSSYILKER